MFQQIKNKLYNYSEVAGLYLVWTSAGQMDLHLVLLEKVKNSIQFKQIETFVEDFESLKNVLSTEIPLVLILDGKGILHKKITQIPAEVEAIPKAVLPNANPDDFCFQVIDNEEFSWVSLGRKEAVNAILNQLKNLGFSVVQLGFGVFSAQHLLPLLEEQKATLNLGYSQISFSENKIQDLQKNTEVFPTTLFLADDPLPNLVLPAAGAAFQQILNIPHQIYNTELTEKAAEDFRYQHWFKLFGWTLLIGIFAILLINFIAFSGLDAKIKNQEIELAYHRQQLQKLDTLKNQYEEKAGFFNQNQLLENSKISFYADEIAASMPSGIQLLDLDIFPSKATQQQRREKLFLFDKKIIYIKGTSRRSPILNEWIKVLEAMDWVEKVKVLPYSEAKGGVGTFELELELI